MKPGRRVQVSSEFGRLRTVIVHKPDEGLERVTPDKAQELLYEDIVDLPAMQQEHSQFVEAMEALGIEVLELQDLLEQILDSHSVRNNLVNAICTLEQQPTLSEQLLRLPSNQLALALIAGIVGDKEIFSPIPNFIFTRDIGAVINSKILLTNPAKSARMREAILAQYIFTFHPRFDVVEKIKLDSDVTIEGGDVIVVNAKHVAVGCGERTTAEAIESLAQKIIGPNGGVKKVSRVIIPSQRSSMHLDTVVSLVDHSIIVAYEPVVCGQSEVVQHCYKQDDKNYKNIHEMLQVDNQAKQTIACGGGVYPHDFREQWQDGANLLTLAPGVCIGYDRNRRTTTAMEEVGFKTIAAVDLIAAITSGYTNPEEFLKEKWFISISSSELSRARGGTHCLSLPILRDSI